MITYPDILRYWQLKRINSSAELETALNDKIISLSYHSGKIENDAVTYADTREIFEHDRVIRYTGDLRTLFEIRNSKDAFRYLLDCFARRLPLTAALILSFHEQLTKNTYDQARWDVGERPGTFKLHDYVVGRDEVGALPEDVSIELDELLAELIDVSDEHILISSAYFHCKFENIHPFADGNGRVGRLALNYFLLIHNHPPVIIHEEDRLEYFAALEAWDRFQRLEPMTDYLRSQTVKTWSRSLRQPCTFYTAGTPSFHLRNSL